MDIDWTGQLAQQLDWHWNAHLRPRMDGLTDEEYRWEPVPGMWSVRPRGESTAPVVAGSGDFVIEWAQPEPDPVPATTIAWRLGHLLVGVFGMRVAGHFGGKPVDYESYDYPGDAATALARLDEVYAAWNAGVRALGPQGLRRPCGPPEAPYFDNEPMAALVLHINREAIHHCAEIALLRDLYRWQA
jgi:DinB superfamily